MTFAAFNLGDLRDPVTPDAHIALVDARDWDAPTAFTHGELDAACQATARGLLRRGLNRGDRVAIISNNRVEYLLAYFGAMRAGLVAVPVNPRFPRDTIAYILADADIKFVLCDDSGHDVLPDETPSVSFDDQRATGFQHLLDPGLFETVKPAPSETAMILYTSGSSGQPKGVPLSHDGHLWCVHRRVAAGQFSQERLLIAAPLFHMNGLGTAKFAVAAGATIVLLPRFEAGRYLEAAARFRCTWLTGVPAMYAMVTRERALLDRLDLSAVRNVRLGSAPATQKLIDDVRAVFPGASVSIVYGTTEAGPVVFGPHPDGLKKPDLALGWPVPGVMARFANPEMEAAGEGTLVLRTPAIMAGYLNLPEKTAEVMTPDGGYITGDIFRRSPEGHFTFVGRDDDMISCGGENIFPAEVETLLERHPSIAQASVVGITDEIKGEKPVAFVVLKAGTKVSEHEIKTYTLSHGPAYRHPRRVMVMAELPLAGTAKVDRKALKALAEKEWG